MTPGSRRPAAPGTERCHHSRMTGVIRQRLDLKRLLLVIGRISHQSGSLGGNDKVSSRCDRDPAFGHPSLGDVDDAGRALFGMGSCFHDDKTAVRTNGPVVLHVPIGKSREITV